MKNKKELFIPEPTARDEIRTGFLVLKVARANGQRVLYSTAAGVAEASWEEWVAFAQLIISLENQRKG